MTMADVPDLDGGAADGSAEFARAVENMAAQDRLAAEAAERRKQAARELRDLYGDFADRIDKAAKRNKALADSMRDGTFARQARDVAELNRQYEQMQRRAELSARFGDRAGGWLARNDKLLGTAGRAGSFAAGATLTTGAGLVRQGFSGTVEEKQLEREMKMLGRELAGAMKPVIDVTTRGVRSLREFMEGLGPAGQNVVMFGGLALSAGMSLRLLGAGAGVGSAVASRFIGGGAAATAGSGAAAFGGQVAANRAKTAKGVVTRGAVAAYAIETANKTATGGYYEELRTRGHNKFLSALGAFGFASATAANEPLRWLGITDQKSLDEQFREGIGTGRESSLFGKFSTADQVRVRERTSADPTRRQVNVAGGGFDEGGAAYDRLNSAISTVEAERGASPDDSAVGEGVIAELGRAAADLKAAAADIKASVERRDGPPLRRPGE